MKRETKVFAIVVPDNIGEEQSIREALNKLNTFLDTGWSVLRCDASAKMLVYLLEKK